MAASIFVKLDHFANILQIPIDSKCTNLGSQSNNYNLEKYKDAKKKKFQNDVAFKEHFTIEISHCGGLDSCGEDLYLGFAKYQQFKIYKGGFHY